MSDTRDVLTTRSGEVIGVGDRVATRRIDRDLGVANRDTWTVTGVGPTAAWPCADEPATASLPSGVRAGVCRARLRHHRVRRPGRDRRPRSPPGRGDDRRRGGVRRHDPRPHGNTAHLVADTVDVRGRSGSRCSPATAPTSVPPMPPASPPTTSTATAPVPDPCRPSSGAAALQAAALDRPRPRRPREPSPVLGPRPTAGSASASEVAASVCHVINAGVSVRFGLVAVAFPP